MRSFDGVFARIWRIFILDSCRLDLKDSREGLKYAVCAKTVSRGCLFWCILDVLDYFRLISGKFVEIFAQKREFLRSDSWTFRGFLPTLTLMGILGLNSFKIHGMRAKTQQK